MTQERTDLQSGPIDAVICWVDGTDPAHIARRAQYLGQDTNPIAQEVNAPRRWSYSDELDICLRTLDKNAPWIRRVYLVTNGQVPSGLDLLPRTIAKKIELIDHRVIFEGYEQNLPTFNSMAIESMIWRIPGLAECFIYFNDDMFLGAPCKREDFFRGEKTVINGKWLSISGNKINRYKTSIHRAAKINAAKVFGYTPEHFFSPAHVAMAMRVSTLKTLFEQHPDVFDKNISGRFRAEDQYLVQGLFAGAALTSNSAILAKPAYYENMSAAYCRKVPYLAYRLNLWAIKSFPNRFRLLCVNDLALLQKRFGSSARTQLYQALGLDAPNPLPSDSAPNLKPS